MEHIRNSVEDRVLKLVIDRPDKKNALSHAMYRALVAGFDQAARDPEIRAVYLTGAGGVFTAGNDLQDFAQAPPLGPDAPVMQFLDRLLWAEKPVVAAVNGLAVGVGLTMLLHCDLVYASRTASFRAPFADLALVPEAGSSLLLPRLTGPARAAEIFLLGETMSAEEALSCGLVGRLFPPDELDAAAWARAQMLAAKAPSALRATKKLMRPDRAAIAAHMRAEAALFAAQLKSADLQEAIRAFYEKRPPAFE